MVTKKRKKFDSDKTWIDINHESLDRIRSSNVLKDQLDSVARNAESSHGKVKDYRRLMNDLIAKVNFPIDKHLFQGRFISSRSNNVKLALGIDVYNDRLRAAVSKALEEYSENNTPYVLNKISEYNESNAILEKLTEETFDAPVTLKISNDKVWEMFHVNDKFINIKEGVGLEAIHLGELLDEVIYGLKELNSMVVKDPVFCECILMNRIAKKLMFNKSFGLGPEGLSIARAVPPKRNTGLTVEDWSFLKGISVTVIPIGVTLGFMSGMGVVMGTLTAAVTTLGLAIRHVIIAKAYRVFFETQLKEREIFVEQIKDILALSHKVSRIKGQVELYVETLETLSSADSREAKRIAAPILEAVSGIVGHMIELTYGLTKTLKR